MSQATKRGASPYATGAGGTVLEHRYGALLLSHLLTGDPLPELGSDATVTRVAFQARAESEVDDFMVVGRVGDGTERRAFVAVRSAPKIVPSDQRSVDLLATYLPSLLNDWSRIEAGLLRLALASSLTTPIRELAQLTTIARATGDATAFQKAVAEPGRTNAKVRNRLRQLERVVEKALQRCDSGVLSPSELTWRFLSSIAHVRELRLEPPDQSDYAAMTARLRAETAGGTAAEASGLAMALGKLATGYAPSGAEVSVSMLRRDLEGSADLGRSSHYPTAWGRLEGLDARLRQRTRSRLVDLSQRELELDRGDARDSLAQMLLTASAPSSPPLVVSGAPDVGKSALTLGAAEDVRGGGAAVTALSLRDLRPTTVETERELGAPLEDVLAGTDVRSLRLLVIDGAEAALEGRQGLLRDLATAAMRAGLGVAAVTRTDGEHKVAEMLAQAATAAGIDTPVPARHTVGGLTRAEISEVTSAFPALGRLNRDGRNTWLLARPGLVDILLRAGPAVALPDRALSEADVFAAVWSQLVRRGESAGDDRVSPDERERALTALARRTLDPEAPSDGPAPRALASLRSDGLLLPAGPTAAWSAGDDFASDLVRDFALARLMRRDGYKPLLSTVDPPRWALRAARLACQAALSAPGDSEDARRAQQAQFDQVAGTGGARWSEVPLEALLTLPDALDRAWSALSTDPEQGLATLIRVALQRYTAFGIGDSHVLAPLIEVLHDRPPRFDGHVGRSLGEKIVELRLAWLSGLVVSGAEPNPLRARIRDTLLEQPIHWDESLIEALAMLGPDLDGNVNEYLRDLAAEHPGHLAPAVESIVAVSSLVQHQPDLLADLTEAYYIDLPRDDDNWRGGYHPVDDGVRRHERRGAAFGSPMAGWGYGPFWRLLLWDARKGLQVINRILDHAARARVRSLNYLGREFGEPQTDGLSGLEIELPGVGKRFCTGDSHVWMWYRGSSVGPYPCVSALLAVERFADQLIDIGVGPGEVAKLLLEDCHNLAMPGLVVGMLVRHLENLTDELDIWLSQPQLWPLEFAREVQEGLLHVQGADPEDTHGRERRRFNLRDATAFLVLSAMVHGDEVRAKALRECGQELLRRVRSGIPDLDPDDDSRDQELHELATVSGWAATFDVGTYGPGRLPDGRAIVEHQSPAHIEAALHDHNEGLSQIQESYRLIAAHTVSGGRNASSQTIVADFALARSLLGKNVAPSGLDPRAAAAAVAKSAVLAYADQTLTLSADELEWAREVLIDCAIEPYVGEYAFDETTNPMEADRSAAAALPALLLLSAQGAPGSPTCARVVEALLASATSEFHEVRQITVTALGQLWVSDCAPIDGRDRCIHDAALRAAEAAARMCRLGPLDESGHRDPSPITGPVLVGLAATAPEDVRPVYLIAPIAAASDAAASRSCVRESGVALLNQLLEAHIRSVVHGAAQGHYNDTPERHFEVARALFSHAASGEHKYLVRHLTAYAGYPTALGPLLHNLSELATYDARLRSALPHVWPLVMEPVLDAFDRGVDARSDRSSANFALAGLLPQPALSPTDRDPETRFTDASADWIDPGVLSPLIDRWIPLGRGSALCVDAMVGLVRTAAPAWQAGVGLAWVAELIGNNFEPLAGRCPFLATWLDELRNSSHLDAARRATLHRIVDGLAAHGDIRAVAFQRAEE